MWQADRAATNISSGSTPAGSDQGSGTTEGEAEPSVVTPPSNDSVWARL
jgi:hypothetical protein